MDNATLIDELVRDEGLRLKPYLDSRGIETIGVGRNLRDVGLSREEAFHLLNNDIERMAADLDHALPWWRKLDEVRQRVVANMAFNLGVQKLCAFARTLSFIQSGDYDAAATEMLCSAWAAQVGPRAQRLSKMMREGIA